MFLTCIHCWQYADSNPFQACRPLKCPSRLTLSWIPASDRQILDHLKYPANQCFHSSYNSIKATKEKYHSGIVLILRLNTVTQTKTSFGFFVPIKKEEDHTIIILFDLLFLLRDKVSVTSMQKKAFRTKKIAFAAFLQNCSASRNFVVILYRVTRRVDSGLVSK